MVIFPEGSKTYRFVALGDELADSNVILERCEPKLRNPLLGRLVIGRNLWDRLRVRIVFLGLLLTSGELLGSGFALASNDSLSALEDRVVQREILDPEDAMVEKMRLRPADRRVRTRDSPSCLTREFRAFAESQSLQTLPERL